MFLNVLKYIINHNFFSLTNMGFPNWGEGGGSTTTKNSQIFPFFCGRRPLAMSLLISPHSELLPTYLNFLSDLPPDLFTWPIHLTYSPDLPLDLPNITRLTYQADLPMNSLLRREGGFPKRLHSLFQSWLFDNMHKYLRSVTWGIVRWWYGAPPDKIAALWRSQPTAWWSQDSASGNIYGYHLKINMCLDSRCS